MLHRAGCVAQATCTSMLLSVKGAGVSRRADKIRAVRQNSCQASFRILGAFTLDGVLNQDNGLSANGGQEPVPGLFVLGGSAQHFVFAKLLGNAKSGVAL